MAKPILERDRTGRSCPRCRVGEIVKRKGRYGYFMGCTAYRSGCTYTEQIVDESADRLAIEAATDQFLRAHGCGHLTGFKDLPRWFKRK